MTTRAMQLRLLDARFRLELFDLEAPELHRPRVFPGALPAPPIDQPHPQAAPLQATAPSPDSWF